MYLFAGRPLLKFSSWGLASVNYKLGNRCRNCAEAAEDFIGIATNMFTLGTVKSDFLKGALTDRDINAYIVSLEVKSGRRISYRERRGLEYIKKLSSVLDDDSRKMVLNSIEKYEELRERIVTMLPMKSREKAKNYSKNHLQSCQTWAGCVQQPCFQLAR